MEGTVVRQLSFKNPDSSEKLAKEKTEIKKPIFMFPQDTIIWSSVPLSDRRRMGAIRNEQGIEAIRILDSRTNKPAKEKRLSLWQTINPIRLYLREKYWELPENHTFLTHAKNAKKTREVLIIKK